MKKGIESIGKFVVSGSDTPKLLEAIEEALDQMTRPVTMPVDETFVLPITTGRNIGKRPARFDGFDQFITVVTFVGGHRGSLDAGDQGRPLSHVGDLSSGQNQTKGVAQGIDTGMDLRAQPTPRPADRLIATVFLAAPAECWWARTIVASMNNSSRSASPWSASATRLHTPPTSQRANRTYTECQFPNSLGKSRHGHPVRAMNNTASTKRRLSAARPPLSVGLPGSRCAIRNHCLSFNISRSMTYTQIPGCKHKSATVNRP